MNQYQRKRKRMSLTEIARAWKEALGMEDAPVAIAFCDDPPEGVEPSAEPSPSACTFWRRGQKKVFYANADDHSNCPIGLMTMGFSLSADQSEKAMSLVTTMASLHYFDPSEVAHLPSIKKPHRVVVYGPLDKFPVEPDLVLFMLDGFQTMLAAEAIGQVMWAEQVQLGVFGRPACAALAKAAAIDQATMSLGCIGARTYTDLKQEEMLLVLTFPRLQAATEKLSVVLEANQKLAAYHSEQRRAITGNG
jgi:uncharacterized protein (DUF169 family)